MSLPLPPPESIEEGGADFPSQKVLVVKFMRYTLKCDSGRGRGRLRSQDSRKRKDGQGECDGRGFGRAPCSVLGGTVNPLPAARTREGTQKLWLWRLHRYSEGLAKRRPREKAVCRPSSP